MIYVLFLCTVFDGQPNLNSCEQLEVGRYSVMSACQIMIPVLIRRNLQSGRSMDDGDIHHYFKCAPPRTDVTDAPPPVEPSFSKFTRNNVGQVTLADMTLPAPVQSFQLFCVAKSPGQPYRLAVSIDPESNSYKEVDRSDRADPSNPKSWEGKINEARVGMYFPTIDGTPTLSYSISNIHVGDGILRLDPSTWIYWRNKSVYDCIGSERDGELPLDLIHKLKSAANQN